MYPNRWWNLSLGVVALMSFTVALGGCNGFFVCEGKASCPTTVTETVTTDLAYVSNSTSGASYLNIYNLTNGTLAQISGSPFSLGYEPVAMAMAPSNGYLYVATLPGSTNPGVYGYSISSTGTLTALSSTALATDSVASMAISPDGNWLYTVSTTGQTMEQYSVNTSTGALSPNVGFNLSGSAGCALNTSGISAAVNQCMVKVSPTGDFVAVALGGSGVYTFSYSSANGITNAQAVGSIGTGSATVGYYSLTIDSNHYLYRVHRDDELTHCLFGFDFWGSRVECRRHRDPFEWRESAFTGGDFGGELFLLGEPDDKHYFDLCNRHKRGVVSGGLGDCGAVECFSNWNRQQREVPGSCRIERIERGSALLDWIERGFESAESSCDGDSKYSAHGDGFDALAGWAGYSGDAAQGCAQTQVMQRHRAHYARNVL